MLSEIIKGGGLVVVMQWVGGWKRLFLVVVGLCRVFSTDSSGKRARFWET